MSQDLLDKMDARVKELGMTRSQYLRHLIKQELESGQPMVLGQPTPEQSTTADESVRKLARKAAEDAVAKVRARRKREHQ